MTIVVSACLLGRNCKYSGGNNYSAKLERFLEGHRVIAVCPEVMGGLPTPRPASEIVNGVVMNCEGKCVDREFRLGAQTALQKALEAGAELAILQSRSPSCGPKEVYDGTFSKKRIPGQGIFAQKLTEAGIRILDIEELK